MEVVNKYVRVPFFLRSGVRSIMSIYTLRAISLGHRLVPDFTVLLRDNLETEELVVFRVSCTDSGYPETGYNTKLKRAWIWSSDRRHGIVSSIIRKGVLLAVCLTIIHILYYKNKTAIKPTQRWFSRSYIIIIREHTYCKFVP